MRKNRRRGFTLIELLVIIAIIGILATIVVANYVTEIPKAKVAKAKADIRMIMDALDRFKLSHDEYPTTEQGLKALITKPATGDMKNPDAYPTAGYVQGIPKDPWGNEYQYVYPGSREGLYDLTCYGADGKEGGEGFNADITNRNLAGGEQK